MIISIKSWLITYSLDFQNSMIRVWRWLLFRPATDDPKRILIIRRGSIGDGICALPALNAIKKHYSGSEIHWLLDAKHSDLTDISEIAPSNLYDQIIDKRHLNGRELRDALRSSKYDLVIHLPQPKAKLFTLLKDMWDLRTEARIRSGYGWKLDAVFFLKQHQEAHRTFIDERSRLMEIVAGYGVDMPSEDVFPITADVSEDEIIQRLAPLENSQKPRIAIIPGAKRPQNRWPLSCFNSLITELVPKYDIILLGGKSDLTLSSQLISGNGILNLIGKTSLKESAGILALCERCISNDTGPMHLSYAVGTPVTAIFSSRDFPEIWFPPKDDRNAILRTDNFPCGVCLSDTCNDNRCIQSIQVRDVLATI